MKALKIGVISSTVFKIPLWNYGGLELVAWQQAKGLAERGHEVTLFAPDGSECSGCKIFPFGPAGRISEDQAYAAYWQELLKLDVILSHDWNKWAYLLKAEGKLKAPILAWLHAPPASMFNVWPPQFPNFPPLERACPVCISQDQALRFEFQFHRVPRWCYNAVDVDGFYKDIGLPRTDRFLFLARFSSIKGPSIAIQCCKEVGVDLDLIGDTSITNEPDYFNYCKNLCDGTHIKMVGPASRGNCVYWMSRAYAFCHPNKFFAEPFGLAPGEAMACGLPVICWNLGALRETVVHNETGFIANNEREFMDGILKYANMPDAEMSKVREACRDNARRFTLDKMINRVEELMVEALDGGW